MYSYEWIYNASGIKLKINNTEKIDTCIIVKQIFVGQVLALKLALEQN